jgi:hypothetical protein
VKIREIRGQTKFGLLRQKRETKAWIAKASDRQCFIKRFNPYNTIIVCNQIFSTFAKKYNFFESKLFYEDFL